MTHVPSLKKPVLQRTLWDAAVGPNGQFLDAVAACWDGRLPPLPVEADQTEIILLVLKRCLNGVEYLGTIQTPAAEDGRSYAEGLTTLVAEHRGSVLHLPPAVASPDDFPGLAGTPPAEKPPEDSSASKPVSPHNRRRS